MSFHPEDYRCLEAWRMTQHVDLLAQEYWVRQRMFHALNGQGAIGVLAMISLVRDFKLEPPLYVAPRERIDWRRYPANGKVRVEVTVQPGRTLTGVYLGETGPGLLAIRLDGDSYVREFKAVETILAADQNALPPEVKQQPVNPEPVVDEFPKLAELLENPAAAFILDTVSTITETAPPASLDYEIPAEPAPETVVTLDEALALPLPTIDERPLDKSQCDWAALPAGSPIWVSDDEAGTLDGTLVAWLGDKLSVNVAGEVREFETELCVPGG